MRLYDDIVDWYRLVDPAAEHEPEATVFTRALERGATPRPESLLELGAGAGHNALFMKRRFRCTLTDLSPAMQALSRKLNPECEHLPGDMRTLRLGRTFDTVLVHDAVMYMVTEADLRAAVETAFVHTRPGGAAVFAPDCFRETLVDRAEHLFAEDGTRVLHGLEWSFDPDPADTTYQVDYSFLLREGRDVRAVHDRHVEGVFPEDTWFRILESAGFVTERFERPIDYEGATDRVFLARRP